MQQVSKVRSTSSIGPVHPVCLGLVPTIVAVLSGRFLEDTAREVVAMRTETLTTVPRLRPGLMSRMPPIMFER